MSWDGTVPGIKCKGCGVLLGEAGGGPIAENYMGTYNGLCYKCTSVGPYVETIYLLDGAIQVNYPPHSPSWRRDRETYHAYVDCPDCYGKGMKMVSRSMARGGSYPSYCNTCFERYHYQQERQAMNEEITERNEELFNAHSDQFDEWLKENSLAIPEDTMTDEQNRLATTERDRIRGLYKAARAKTIQEIYNTYQAARAHVDLAPGALSLQEAQATWAAILVLVALGGLGPVGLRRWNVLC